MFKAANQIHKQLQEMNFIKSFVMTLVLVMPFLCADLYTKYLAHTELPHEGDTFVVTDHIYAINPVRNYGR